MTDSPPLDADPAGLISRPGKSGPERSGRRSSPRFDAALALTVTGACSVVLGGLVAAITEPLDLGRGSWLAAYLVLVCGVAQYAMGRVRGRQNLPGSRALSAGWAQFGGWNLGNATVIAGTLAALPPLVDAGSVLLVVALLIALRATWHPNASRLTDTTSRLTYWTYRALLLLLIISIPVGILLSHLNDS